MKVNLGERKMIKGKGKVLLLIFSTFILCGCNNTTTTTNKNMTIFSAKSETWVGDPMPYYDGEKFNIFYLEDLRDGDVGFHPWSLFTTKNFYHI
jgi:beta-fructofuranosidase